MGRPCRSRFASVGASGVVAGAVMVSGWGGWSPASQPPAGRVEQATPSVRDVLRRVAMRYRGGPTCERVNVEVRPDGGKVSRSTLLVRLAPRVRDGKCEPSLLLELGRLVVGVSDGVLTAVHSQNQGTYFATEVGNPIDSASLAAVLPPVPLPQLDLARWDGVSDDAAALPDRVGVYARGISWQAVEVEARRPERLTVKGVCAGGTISAVVRGDALQSIEIRLGSPETTIGLTIAPVLPCTASQVRLEKGERARVGSLGELRPQSGLLGHGAFVPDMPLTGVSGQQVRLRELREPPVEAIPAPLAERLALVFIRVGSSNGEGADRMVGRVRAGVLSGELARLRASSYPPAGKPDGEPGDAVVVPPINYAAVLVFDAAPSPDALLAVLKREKDVWGERVLWTTEPRPTIDLFAGRGESAVAIVDGGQRLMASIPIGESMTTEQLLDQVTLGVLETGK